MTKNNKYAITAGLILAALVVFSFWWKNRDAGEIKVEQGTEQNITYYYGQECPHCKEVAKYISDNKIDKKISFVKKEVWHNKKNYAEMMEKAKSCDIDPESQGMGVPFLYARNQCHIGAPDIIEFFKKEAGI